MIPKREVSRLKLERILITPRPIEGWDGRSETSSEAITYLTIDIRGQPHEAYLFIVPELDYSMILGRPWMIGQRATFSFDYQHLMFELGAYAPRAEAEKEIDLRQVGAAAYGLWASQASRKSRRRRGAQVFSASMADIEKALKTKTYTDPREKLPDYYHEFLDIFDRKEADRLPRHRGPKVNHRIELEPGASPP